MEREDFTAPDIEPPILLSGTARKIAERELAKGAGHYALAKYLNTTVEVIAEIEIKLLSRKRRRKLNK